jgi:NAD-dependent deacetylase
MIALTGAGISTPSGIPDFRSPGSGIWENVQDPLRVASIEAFKQDPQAFYDWLYPLVETVFHARPNPAHLALAELESAARLRCVITQNIDLLHSKAGSRVVYELHGHFREGTCMACHTKYPGEPLLQNFLRTRTFPRCRLCRHPIKPDIILFGEVLPVQVLIKAQKAAQQCDLMLVVGSSLSVVPACDLPWIAKQRGAKLIMVNLTATHLDPIADLVIHADAAEILPQLAAPFVNLG